MKSDPLLSALANQIRDDRRAFDDARDERAEELRRPLQPEEQDRLIARIDAATQTPAAASRATSSSARESAGNVRSLRAFMHPRAIAPLVLAACAAFFFLRSAPSADGALPEYALSASGGESSLRGGSETPAATLRVREGSTFEVVLRPSQPVKGAVAARAFVDTGAGLARELTNVTVEASAEGSLRVRGRVEGLGAFAAPAALVLVSGRPDTVGAAGSANGWPPPSGAHVHRVMLTNAGE